MTDLQQKEFALLEQFIRVCDQLGLTYYLVCGSALGAVKYKGFIPWDDDVDVALPRDDYEIFLEKAQALLPDWVFLQNYRTDPCYYTLGSKLRDSRTTYIEKGIAHIPMHHGVYIDVFPLDGYPKTESGIKAFEKRKKHFYRRRYVRLWPPVHRDLGLTVCSCLYWVFGVFKNTAKYVKGNEDLNRSCPVQDSDLWCNYANSVRKTEYSPRWHYGTGTWGEFEGLKVRLPENYHAYLTFKYGDYMADLPAERQRPTHPYTVCDLDNPYTKYVKTGKK